MLQNPHPPAGIPPPRATESPPRRVSRIRVGRRNRIGGRIRVGRRTGIVGVSIGFRTPNHPADARHPADTRHPVGASSHEEPRMNLHA